MKNFKKVIFALMVVFLVVGFIGCKTESDPPKAEVEKWTVVYGEDSLKEGTYAELEEYAGKVGLDETTDYTVDKTNKKIILTDSGMSKVTAYEENNAGNDDNNDEENGSSGGNTGNDNPGNTDTPETPVVTNNFKGKTFLGMTGEGEAARFASYIIFTSDTDCEVMFFDKEPMSAKYTVADDVATLIGTGEYAALQLSTTKLTDGKFSITIPTAVSGEEEDIVVSYAVGTLWTILYADEDFSLKMPEEELDAAVEYYGFGEGDFIQNDAEKTITLTESGWAKVQALMGGGSGEEGGEVYYYYMHDGELIGGKSTLEDFPSEVEHYGLVEGTDYTIDHENKYINFTDSGAEKLGMSGGSDDETWTVLDPEGNTLETFESIEAANAFASSIGLVQDDDFAIDFDNQTITLTAEGLAKVQAAMGGSEG